MAWLLDLHTRTIVFFGRTKRRRANLFALVAVGTILLVASQMNLR